MVYKEYVMDNCGKLWGKLLRPVENLIQEYVMNSLKNQGSKARERFIILTL